MRPVPRRGGALELRVGGRATIVGEGGAPEVVIRTLPESRGKDERRPAGKGVAAPEAESVALAAGTTVEVQAVDGDDARVKVADGPRAGAVYWLECRLLKPVAD